MNDEIHKLELEIAKVRLAKEESELRTAILREERLRKSGARAEKAVDSGISTATSYTSAIAIHALNKPHREVRIVIYYSVSIAIAYGLLYLDLWKINSPWEISLVIAALSVSGASGLLATILLLYPHGSSVATRSQR